MRSTTRKTLSRVLSLVVVLAMLVSPAAAFAQDGNGNAGLGDAEAAGFDGSSFATPAALYFATPAALSTTRPPLTYTRAGLSTARQNNPMMPALYNQNVRVADPFQVPNVPDARPRLMLREGDLDGLRAVRENPNHPAYRWYHGAGEGTQDLSRFWFESVLRFTPGLTGSLPAIATNGILPAGAVNVAQQLRPIQSMALLYLLDRDNPDPIISAQAEDFGREAVQRAADIMRTINLMGMGDHYNRGNVLSDVLFTVSLVYDWAYTFVHEPFVSANPAVPSQWDALPLGERFTHGRDAWVTLPADPTFADIIWYGIHFNVDRRLANDVSAPDAPAVRRGLEFGFPGPGFDGTLGALNGHHVEAQTGAMAAVAITFYDRDTWFWDETYEFFFYRFFPGSNFLAEGGMGWSGTFYGPFRTGHIAKTNYLFYMMQAPGSRVSFLTADFVDIYTSIIYYRRPDGQNIRIGNSNDDTRSFGNQFHKNSMWVDYGILFTNAIFHDPFIQNELMALMPHNAPHPVVVFATMSDVHPQKYEGRLPLTYFMAGPNGEMVARTGWPSPGLADPSLFPLAPGQLPNPAFGPNPQHYPDLINRHRLFDDDWHMDFESNNMVVNMRMGFNTRNHDHLDAGSFQIYYRGALAVRSGLYGGFGNAHNTQWYTSSISHNSLLIRDPHLESRPFFTATPDFNNPHPEMFIWRETPLANTGGQLFGFGAGRANNTPGDIFRGRDGRVRYFTTAQDAIDYARGIADRGILLGGPLCEWRTAGTISAAVERNTLTPEFTHLKGDLTVMYGYRAELATRSFMFFNFQDDTHPGALIVFDHVASGTTMPGYMDFEKYWLLHTLFEPEVVLDGNGNVRHFVVEDTRTVRRANNMPNVNAIPQLIAAQVAAGSNDPSVQPIFQYNGRMVATPLLPLPQNLDFHIEDHRAVRGPGRFGWDAIGLDGGQVQPAQGYQYRGQAIPVTGPDGLWPGINTAEPGEFMLMLSPTNQAQTHHFLNVMQMHEADDSIVPLDVTLVGAETDAMVGAKITGYGDGFIGYVTFFSTGGIISGTSRTQLPNTAGSTNNNLRHFVTDLAPGAWRVYDGNTLAATFTVRAGEHMGMFVLPGGKYTITRLVPAPDPGPGGDTGDDEGDTWVSPTSTPAPTTPTPATPTPPTPATPTPPTPTPAPAAGRVSVSNDDGGAFTTLSPVDINLPAAFAAEMLQRDALNVVLLNEMFELAGGDIPAIVRLYVGDLNLSDEQLVTLVAFALDPGTGEYEIVRGNFNPGRSYFYAAFEDTGIIGFMLYERPVPLLRFTIGHVEYDHNGIPLISDAAPFIIANRTMVPLRLIAEALSATPRWDNDTRIAYIYKGDEVLRLPMGVPLPGGLGIPEMRNNRVFVPARFVIENFDAVALWDGELQQVTVYVW